LKCLLSMEWTGLRRISGSGIRLRVSCDEKHDPAGHNSGNSHNGVSRKMLKGDFGEVEIETPRDRNGEFEPQIVRKNQTRWTGFDDKILRCTHEE
jgi:transposase-like protein